MILAQVPLLRFLSLILTRMLKMIKFVSVLSSVAFACSISFAGGPGQDGTINENGDLLLAGGDITIVNPARVNSELNRSLDVQDVTNAFQTGQQILEQGQQVITQAAEAVDTCCLFL
jgi:hypothetical protein